MSKAGVKLPKTTRLNGHRKATNARTSRPTNTEPEFGAERVKIELRSRFNPLRNLKPDSLVRAIDNFDAGYLRDFAMLAEKMEERDDTLKSVAPKTKQAVARYGFEILLVDFDETQSELKSLADKQKAELEFFYNNVRATHALEQDRLGGFQLLVRQMMDAHGKKYAVHEIVWRRQHDAIAGTDRYAATFWFVPLQFFENTTGKLRFITQPLGVTGEDMEPGAWLVTVGEGVMIACSIAYMFKHLPLKDWLGFCEKFGFPGVHGKTTAAKGTPEWDAMKSAVAAFMVDWGVVTNVDEAIELIEVKSGGDKLPFDPLVDRMDRAMTRLWRGADLGTMSRDKQTVGSNPQQGETEIIEQDLAAWISETLQLNVDPLVIEYAFGPDVPVLAYVKVLTDSRINADQEIKINDHLVNHGARLSLTTEMERFGRAEAKPDEPILTPPIQPAIDEGAARNPAVNAIRVQHTSQLIKKAVNQLGNARLADFGPLLSRIFTISQIDKEAAMQQAAKNLQLQLPKYLKALNAKPAEAEVIKETIAGSFFNGVDDPAKETKTE